MNKKCSDCIACEATEFISPFRLVYICHQGNVVIKDLSVAEECKCYEEAENEE